MSQVLQLAFLQKAAIPDQGKQAPAECKQLKVGLKDTHIHIQNKAKVLDSI